MKTLLTMLDTVIDQGWVPDSVAEELARELTRVRAQELPPETAGSWARAAVLADAPAVHEALQAFVEDATGDNGIGVVQAVLESIASVEQAPPNKKLLELADRIDHERLWARPGMERDKWTQEQRDRCDAGVMLRRYASLLGQDRWRIFPPRAGFSFSASTLEAVVNMARRDRDERS